MMSCTSSWLVQSSKIAVNTGRKTSGGEGAAEGIGICIDEGTYDLRVRIKDSGFEHVKILVDEQESVKESA